MSELNKLSNKIQIKGKKNVVPKQEEADNREEEPQRKTIYKTGEYSHNCSQPTSIIPKKEEHIEALGKRSFEIHEKQESDNPELPQ